MFEQVNQSITSKKTLSYKEHIKALVTEENILVLRADISPERCEITHMKEISNYEINIYLSIVIGSLSNKMSKNIPRNKNQCLPRPVSK